MAINEAHQVAAGRRYLELQDAKKRLETTNARIQVERERTGKFPTHHALEVFKSIGIDVSALLTDLPNLINDEHAQRIYLSDMERNFLATLGNIPEGTFLLNSVSYHPGDSFLYRSKWIVKYGVSIDSNGIYHELFDNETTVETFEAIRKVNVLYAQRLPSVQQPTIRFRPAIRVGEESTVDRNWLVSRTAPLLTLPEGFAINACAESFCYSYSPETHETKPADLFIPITVQPGKLIPPLIPNNRYYS